MIRRILFGLFVSSILCVSHVCAEPAVDTDKKIEKLIANMTLEEKVGQMTMLTSFIFFDSGPDGKPVLNMEKLREAIHTYKVGVMLNPPQNPYSVEQWHWWLGVLQQEIEKTPNKIPMLYGVDSIHGATFIKDATLLPHNIGIGASRNLKAAIRAAEITGNETLATGVKWNFDPVLDLGRQPLWPRFEETFGEDTHLVEQMGVAMIKQYESMGMGSTMKHFVGYSVPASGKDRTPSFITENELWELHMPPFKSAVDAGTVSAMINSGSMNGIAGHANKYLLTDVLREQWGFDGTIVSDWEDIIYLHTRHRVAATPEDAVVLAIDAGLDMSMVPMNYSFPQQLTKLVREGRVSESRIDASVRRILKMKYRLGLFDNPNPDTSFADKYALAEYTEDALALANETMTLVKNDNDFLPLSKETKVLLAGPGADNLGTMHGSWSFSWQGDDEKIFPKNSRTILDAFKAYLGDAELSYIGAPAFDASENYDVRRLMAAAKDVDVIILALGERPYAEQPGVIDDLVLPQEQRELAKAAYNTGKPVVLVFTSGRPRVISDIVDGADAILLAFRPGSRGADAIVSTLYGHNNPSGVLPFTYPRNTGDINTYDHVTSARIQQRVMGTVTEDAFNPQWHFGHGLSYTEFEISKLKVSPTVFKKGGVVTVTAVVKNTGKRAGGKALDLFVSDHFASDSPRAKRLRRFSKVFLKPGQKRKIKFELDAKDFSFVNRHLKTVIEPGTFSVELDGKKVELEYVEK